MMSGREGDEEGFSIVEVLCAFAILSIAAAIFLQTVQLGTRSLKAADERTRVIAAAPKIELLIKASGMVGNLPMRGQTDGFRWEAQPLFMPTSAVDGEFFRFRVFPINANNRRYEFVIQRHPKAP